MALWTCYGSRRLFFQPVPTYHESIKDGLEIEIPTELNVSPAKDESLLVRLDSFIIVDGATKRQSRTVGCRRSAVYLTSCNTMFFVDATSQANYMAL